MGPTDHLLNEAPTWSYEDRLAIRALTYASAAHRRETSASHTFSVIYTR